MRAAADSWAGSLGWGAMPPPLLCAGLKVEGIASKLRLLRMGPTGHHKKNSNPGSALLVFWRLCSLRCNLGSPRAGLCLQGPSCLTFTERQSEEPSIA